MIINGNEYSIGFGPIALDTIEKLIDDSVTRWNEEKISHQYALIYACVKQGRFNEKKAFNMSYEEFINELPVDSTYVDVLKPCAELMVDQFAGSKKKV
jgi:hypothetical protein